jgi:urea transporter
MSTPTTLSNKKVSVVVFALSLLVTLFWLLGNLFDVYQFEVMGVLFEILWLPVLTLTFILPLVSLLLFIKDKFSLKSLNLYSLLLVIGTALAMVFCL